MTEFNQQPAFSYTGHHLDLPWRLIDLWDLPNDGDFVWGLDHGESIVLCVCAGKELRRCDAGSLDSVILGDIIGWLPLDIEAGMSRPPMNEDKRIAYIKKHSRAAMGVSNGQQAETN